jgi:hypothetical protein
MPFALSPFSTPPISAPDLIVGVGIAIMNADAARAVFSAARSEHVEARP